MEKGGNTSYLMGVTLPFSHHSVFVSICVSVFVSVFVYVAVPRKQLNQDFSTNRLLKTNLAFRLVLKMAPNIPQCMLKMIVIQPGPPFHFNGVKIVKYGTQRGKKLSGHD